ncbi:MAG TPA: GMC oxidoreductase [Rhodanobacter sp.]
MRSPVLFGARPAGAGGGRFVPASWLGDADGQPSARGSAQHLGTTRIADDDPRRGVADRDCRVHGLANLHIAGNPVPSTHGRAFPSFTIVSPSLCQLDQLRALRAR